MKSLKAGDKVYWNQKDKSVILAVIGKEPVHEGIKSWDPILIRPVWI